MLSIFKAKVLGMDDVTIEDLAFGAWPLREGDEVKKRGHGSSSLSSLPGFGGWMM